MKLNIEKINMELSRLGMSRYELSKKMNMANQSVYQILSGKRGPSYTFRTVEKFAKALAVDPKDLIK